MERGCGGVSEVHNSYCILWFQKEAMKSRRGIELKKGTHVDAQ